MNTPPALPNDMAARVARAYTKVARLGGIPDLVAPRYDVATVVIRVEGHVELASAERFFDAVAEAVVGMLSRRFIEAPHEIHRLVAPVTVTLLPPQLEGHATVRAECEAVMVAGSV